MDSISVVIMAAGKGKRMNNPLRAKVMALLAGRPLIDYVIDAATALSPEMIVVIVGHCKESVEEFIDSKNCPIIKTVEQSQQLGTGHAVAQAESLLKEFCGNVLILSGDVPLLRKSTLKEFYDLHNAGCSNLSVLTAFAGDPAGYGRIVRNSGGRFTGIVEHKDATVEQLAIKEVNSGIYLVKCEYLFPALASLKNNNAQGEYYLTDIVSIIGLANGSVEAHAIADFNELQGINSVDELKRAEEFFLKQKSNN